MRLMEVGTKMLGKGQDKEAREMFDRGYKMYSLFWAINLNMIKVDDVKQQGIVYASDIQKEKNEDKLLGISNSSNEKTFFSKFTDVLKKAIDCCKE
jgi:hypothetical protein